ncbi:thiamine diphosphokinase [Jeotgalibaca porci]|uniref:Thiamine diphosphokinase n=1 Tax=Jeotgalibaca porci TaxID=1868793 RepID=A0A6G7WFB4_9LACT|nr:thiamine diphosphokinase [Jeotgalibaca porci]NLB98294.1 thiamine diphosphokinase [Lactobacillales bacterium]QIK50950.1 thiamine diphosphokinase [Jeotgalibaca porci]
MPKKAVIVAGGNKEGLKQMLAAEDRETLLIGVDGGALSLLEMGMTPDIAIGDFDSVSSGDLNRIEEKVSTVVKLPTEKDLTDTEAALEYVKEHLDVQEIEMHGLFGGRVDHMLNNLWLAFHPAYQSIIEKIVMKAEKNTVRFYKPGRHIVKKETDKKYLSFIGMTPLEKLTLMDVKYPLREETYDSPVALVSNEFLNEEMTFTFTRGLMAVVQSRD